MKGIILICKYKLEPAFTSLYIQFPILITKFHCSGRIPMILVLKKERKKEQNPHNYEGFNQRTRYSDLKYIWFQTPKNKINYNMKRHLLSSYMLGHGCGYKSLSFTGSFLATIMPRGIIAYLHLPSVDLHVNKISFLKVKLVVESYKNQNSSLQI